MPSLGAPLDLAKYEARNLRAHILGAAPSSPVTGQMYYNSGDNTLYWWDGGAWVSARGGASSTPQATSSTQGTIQLAGDLAGTALSPQIAAGVIVDSDINAAASISKSKLGALGIVNADVAAGAAIAYSKLSLTGAILNGDLAGSIAYSKLALAGSIVNADVAVGAAIAYSKLSLTGAILNGDLAGSISYAKLVLTGSITNNDLAGSIALSKLVTDPLARANHTGTQLAATISDFVTQVRANALNQMAAPNGAVSMGGQLVSSVADPVSPQDAATKIYVDNLSQGIDAKASVKAASVGNLVLSGTQTVDGIALVANDRVLVKDQTTQSANGIYVVAAGAWARATDTDTWNELVSAYVFVEQGTVNSDTGWVSTVDQGGTLNTTTVTWVQFSSAGQAIAGGGLTKAGNTLDVNPDNSTIEVVADQVRVKDAGITNAKLAGAIDLTSKVTGALPVANGGTGAATAKPARETGLGATGYYSSATHGAGTTITITQATHGLRSTRGLVVQVQEEATGNVVLPDISVAATGDVTVTFGASVSANTYRVTVIG